MPKIFTHFNQLSGEWWELRRGFPSTSNFEKILTPKTRQMSASADRYIEELIADTIRLDPPVLTERPMSKAMQNGRDCEPESRRWYAMEKDVDVLQVGGIVSSCGRFWCSSDGLVCNDGVLELKNPAPSTHVKYLLKPQALVDDYKCQVHGSLLVSERKWCDLVSYCAGFDTVSGLIIRVEPDDFTDALRLALDEFNARYMEALKKISKFHYEEAIRRRFDVLMQPTDVAE